MEFKFSRKPVDYPDAIAFMEARVAAIHEGSAQELVWLLEHPSLYTAGTSARAEDMLNPQFPVFQTGRGGQYTYHGPGQLVAYVMLDLKKRQKAPDIKKYICDLEDVIIRTLAHFDVRGERREGRVGIWVDMDIHSQQMPPPYREGEGGRVSGLSLTGTSGTPTQTLPLKGEGFSCRLTKRDGFSNERKIAAIGVRIRHWVTYHGLAINVNPDLSHFQGIVPCGIREHGVTSLQDLGKNVSMEEVDVVLREKLIEVFGKP
jgi:lipoyl(octanoyl) transferase